MTNFCVIKISESVAIGDTWLQAIQAASAIDPQRKVRTCHFGHVEAPSIDVAVERVLGGKWEIVGVEVKS